MKKTMVQIGLIAAITVWAAGCSTACGHPLDEPRDPWWITAEGDSYSYRQRSGGFSEEGSVLSLTFREFTGKQSLWRVTTQVGGVLCICSEASLDVEDALKLYVVGPDRSLRVIRDLSHRTNVYIPAGTSRIIMAGSGSSGTLSITLKPAGEISEHVQIRPLDLRP